MELSIKHITPYLPYDLLFDISHTEYGKEEAKRLKYCKLVGISNTNLIVGCSFKTNIESQNKGLLFLNINVAKPIFKPLSDLTRNNLKEYYNLLMNADLDRVINDVKRWPVNQSYNFTTKFLLKNHYDIYKLINKNLATDINTL